MTEWIGEKQQHIRVPHFPYLVELQNQDNGGVARGFSSTVRKTAEKLGPLQAERGVEWESSSDSSGLSRCEAERWSKPQTDLKSDPPPRFLTSRSECEGMGVLILTEKIYRLLKYKWSVDITQSYTSTL